MNPASAPSKSAKPVLEISGLQIWRGDTFILNNINWRIDPKQHWVILGANGSGKTSLLSALTGYLEFSAGRIRVLGQEFGRSDWRELRKQIGLVSSAIRQKMADSETALSAVASGKYAVIDYWGSLRRADAIAARRLLKSVECDHLADRPWAFLSQGERQRILIGRALMAKPRLLILDEPCAGLDPAARDLFLAFLQRLGSQRAAPTLIFVTHHVEEILPVFSHLLLLKNGRVAGAGPIKPLLTSASLSQVFDAPMRLRQTRGRYTLDSASRGRRSATALPDNDRP